MNEYINGPADGTPGDDFVLRRQLRDLPRERAPERDLWADIEAALPARRPQRARRWHLGWGMAAAALLGVALLPNAPSPDAPQPATATLAGKPRTGLRLDRDAVALNAEYRAAFAEVAAMPLPPPLRAAAEELNLSARELRAALRHAPGSVALLNQLRRTYEMRLRLNQRAALS